MRDNRNFILVKDYMFKPLQFMGEDLEKLTKASARCGVSGVYLTRINVYCRCRTSKVYQLATELGFREEIRA